MYAVFDLDNKARPKSTFNNITSSWWTYSCTFLTDTFPPGPVITHREQFIRVFVFPDRKWRSRKKFSRKNSFHKKWSKLKKRDPHLPLHCVGPITCPYYSFSTSGAVRVEEALDPFNPYLGHAHMVVMCSEQRCVILRFCMLQIACEMHADCGVSALRIVCVPSSSVKQLHTFGYYKSLRRDIVLFFAFYSKSISRVPRRGQVYGS